MTVTFCGHSEVINQDDVRVWLHETVEKLIELGVDMFLLGGYGAFDRMASSVVWKLKQEYPHIQSVLVKPYPDREMDESECDWTVYPGLENVPRKFAISQRNRYMTRQITWLPTLHMAGAVQRKHWSMPNKKRKVLYTILISRNRPLSVWAAAFVFRKIFLQEVRDIEKQDVLWYNLVYESVPTDKLWAFK